MICSFKLLAPRSPWWLLAPPVWGRGSQKKKTVVFACHCCNPVADVQILTLHRPHDPLSTRNQSPVYHLMSLLLPNLGPTPEPPSPTHHLFGPALFSDLARRASALDLTLQRTPHLPFGSKVLQLGEKSPDPGGCSHLELQQQFQTSFWVMGSQNSLPEWYQMHFSGLCRTFFSRFIWASLQVYTSRA